MMKTQTKYACYGWQYNVRNEYRNLPFQPFWTWLTGKGIPYYCKPEYQLKNKTNYTYITIIHLMINWLSIGLCLYLVYIALQLFKINLLISITTLLLCQLIIVNRMRSFQATFHYMTHGGAIKNKKLALRLSNYIISMPLLYVNWDRYFQSHVSEHHHPTILCSTDDPDLIFIKQQGFSLCMSEFKFWLLVFF